MEKLKPIMEIDPCDDCHGTTSSTESTLIELIIQKVTHVTPSRCPRCYCRGGWGSSRDQTQPSDLTGSKLPNYLPPCSVLIYFIIGYRHGVACIKYRIRSKRI